MSGDYNTYESPFCTRYASKEMQYVFSAQKKFGTFRRLWVALARAEMKLGLNITQEQVDQLEKNVDNIDFAVAEKREKEVRTGLPRFGGYYSFRGNLLLCGG